MTKIDIFSGFLGAGKTTLIKKLIKEAFQGEKLVLIENEFGEIGIDGGFMKDAGINVTEMNSGCICCSLVGDFGAALEEVLEKYHPDRIIIEPSGVGKLSDVIKAVSGVMESHADVQMNGYVTVADATKCKMYMKNFGEFYNNQVESAKTIVLSRTGKITDEKLDAALALIREKNDKATIITTPWDEIDGKQILGAIEESNALELELMEEEDVRSVDIIMITTMNTTITMSTVSATITTMNMNTIITTGMASAVVDMTTSMDIITIMRTMYLQAWVSRVRTNTVRKN